MYSEINKYFIQFMMSKGSVDYFEADEFIKTFSGHTKEITKKLETVISEINDKISDHLFRIILRRNELTGDRMCCLINTGNDEISKMPGEFSVIDHQLFENILKEIMMSSAKYITGIFCLNLGSKIKVGMSKDLIQKKIDMLCEIGYLIKDEGNIYLGPRATSEYEDYLSQQFNDRMTTCNLCSEYVYFGQICAHCEEVIHNYCMDQYKYKGEKCPVCKEQWEAAEGREYAEAEQSAEEDGNETILSPVH